MPRARSASSVDLPTPEPAKTPMRWPRATGRTVSKSADPVASRAPSPLRVAGAGGARRSVALAAPGVSGRPSSGWPKASTIRPTQEGSGWTPATPSRVAASPTAAPSIGA